MGGRHVVLRGRRTRTLLAVVLLLRGGCGVLWVLRVLWVLGVLRARLLHLLLLLSLVLLLLLLRGHLRHVLRHLGRHVLGVLSRRRALHRVADRIRVHAGHNGLDGPGARADGRHLRHCWRGERP